MSDRSATGTDRCRCCSSPDPRTVHGEFIKGMCLTCSGLIEGRMRRSGETIEEAISHFEETNVLSQLRDLRAEAEGREVRTDGGQPDNPYCQECALPECSNEVSRAKGICDDCQPGGGSGGE